MRMLEVSFITKIISGSDLNEVSDEIVRAVNILIITISTIAFDCTYHSLYKNQE